MKNQGITALLEAHAAGDGRALGRLFELAYGELIRLARGQRRRGGAPLTLDSRALVHEAYLRLAGGQAGAGRHREHFLAVAARAMRHALVDHVRALGRAKRGGDRVRVTLTHGAAVESFEPERLLALHQALERLATLEPRLVQVVECRYFLGLSEAETASALGVSLRTIQRDWRAASLWLARELAARPAGEEPA